MIRGKNMEKVLIVSFSDAGNEAQALR